MMKLLKSETMDALLSANDDVVDGDENEFDEKSNESHNEESDCRCQRNLHKFISIRL